MIDTYIRGNLTPSLFQQAILVYYLSGDFITAIIRFEAREGGRGVLKLLCRPVA